MKKLNLFLVFLLISLNIVSYSQIGVLTNTPDASSALDIVSTTKGLLIPRVTLTSSLSSPSPVTSPATGLLVYNSGANQPEGFYYWSGSSWVKLETGTGTITSWELTGNSGTTVGTNFVGTTDDEALAFNTNGVEKLRILSNGQVMIAVGYVAPYSDNMFTVNSNSTYVDAINAYTSGGYGVYSRTYGLTTRNYALYGNADGIVSVRARSLNTSGNGLLATGNNVSASYPTSGSGGALSGGTFGVYSRGKNSDGTGVGAAGNNLSVATISGGSGGAFKGSKYGIYAKGDNASDGNGIGAVGNGGSTIYVPTGGSGGSFTGETVGAYGKGNSATSNGIIGRGNGGATYHYPTVGSGGSFTGEVGVYGYSDVADGNAVVGSVLGETYSTPGYGTGGSFTGPIGVYGRSTGETGTGIIGVGNDGSSYATLNTGSGGAFIGYSGVYGKGTDTDEGHGVTGLGNNGSTRYTLGDGSGGSFTGNRVGVEGFATLQGSTSYGVYGKYNGGGNVNGVGVYGFSDPANNRGYGVMGVGGNAGVYSVDLMATSGSMVLEMDHPLDPKNKILKHYAMESPEVLNIYRGNINLDGNGEATVSLPEYFNSININYSYNLTPIGQQAPNLFIKEEVNGTGSFIISGGNANQKISWVVYAERNDLYMQRERENKPEMVEVEKEGENKGKYLMPSLYNQPPEMGIFYSGKSIEIKTDRQNKSQIRKVVTGKGTSDKEIITEEVQVKEKDD